MGELARLTVFSRDEAKQHYMRVEYQQRRSATDEIIFRNFEQKLQFRIGDVRDFHSVASALRDADVVINAAALKQVPTCEYFPFEAVQTNVTGAENIVRAIEEHRIPIETVVGVSTDKACKPINTMGMTKAIQERASLSKETCVARRPASSAFATATSSQPGVQSSRCSTSKFVEVGQSPSQPWT